MRYVATTLCYVLDNHIDLVKENYEDMGDSGEFSPDYDFYKTADEGEMSFAIVAYDGDKAVGYASVLAARLNHSDVIYASNDAYYVKPAYRGGVVAGRLLVMMEREAKRRGCDTFLWEVPVRSALADALAKRKTYVLSEVIYEKEL